MAPGVGFEPTRPEGAQADSRAYSRHGPACSADCPVPGSGIPAKTTKHFNDYFPFWEASDRTPFDNPVIELQRRIAFESEKPRRVVEKSDESGDGSGPANNP